MQRKLALGIEQDTCIKCKVRHLSRGKSRVEQIIVAFCCALLLTPAESYIFEIKGLGFRG